ncbi:GM18506 [Drosophila sechellia]|uniref:GM18506 n=1 Tax=Drosophila sechellia TaxID=7238 RepID=B4I193_DROSE|nr:GM18506 [Drosophila sechellia]
MSTCSSSEIAEKKRIALAKLQAKKSQLLASASATNGKSTTSAIGATQHASDAKSNPNQPQAKSPLNFYRSPTGAQQKISRSGPTPGGNKSSSFLNALKAIKQTSARELSRGAAHPYQRPNGGNERNKPTLSLCSDKEKPVAVLLGNSITCNLYLVSTHRFAAQTSGYHEQLVTVFKNMPTKSFDGQTRIWSFDLSDYQSLTTHAADLKPYVHMNGIPKKVLDLCRQPPVVPERSVLASIEPKLADPANALPNRMGFATRYCDGKQSTFGWDANGQSNLEELKVILNFKYMLRRTKVEVLPQLAEKNRETVVLDPALVWTNEETKETLDAFNKELKTAKGRASEEILLRFYARTAEVKTRAVCAYLKTIVKEQKKFIIFAHHRVMMDAISDFLSGLKVHYIRIDGQTRSDLRSDSVDTFQKKSSCKVALLSLKACNSGITLTAAEIIVFAELDWNPSTLAQAESRAHRIGQTKPVICRYLMAHNTADDIIWNMLKNKQEVLSKVGIFAENLQKATATAAPTSSHKIEEYFSPCKSNSLEPERNGIKQYFSTVPAKEHLEQNNNTEMTKVNKAESDIAAFFNDDDDEAFLDLDI